MRDVSIGAATYSAASLDIIGAFQQQEVAIRLAQHCMPQAAAELGDIPRDEPDVIVLEFVHPMFKNVDA